MTLGVDVLEEFPNPARFRGVVHAHREWRASQQLLQDHGFRRTRNDTRDGVLGIRGCLLPARGKCEEEPQEDERGARDHERAEMAERGGFEPPARFPVQLLSRVPPSANSVTSPVKAGKK